MTDGSRSQYPSCVSRSTSGRVEERTNTSQPSSCVPVPRSQWSNQPASSASKSMRGPGIAVVASACAHGPASSRCGVPSAASRATVRKVLLRYPSAQPATIIVGIAIRSYPASVPPSRTDPWSQ